MPEGCCWKLRVLLMGLLLLKSGRRTGPENPGPPRNRVATRSDFVGWLVGAEQRPATRGRPDQFPGLVGATKKQRAQHDVDEHNPHRRSPVCSLRTELRD